MCRFSVQKVKVRVRVRAAQCKVARRTTACHASSGLVFSLIKIKTEITQNEKIQVSETMSLTECASEI